MTHYARIQDGIVMELVDPVMGAGGRETPIDQRFAPQIVEALVAVPDGATVAQGDTYSDGAFGPALAAPAAPVPQAVTARQARLQLLDLGKLDAVAAALAALPSPQREQAQIEWEFATQIDRASPLVALLGKKLKLDLDALFAAAALR